MSVLSDQEKERIREVENLKESIRKELQKPKKDELISGFFAHPAVLLILGFVLTGLVGGALTDKWKAREWDNQQH
jgi:preprotein translocase subunit Sss1